MRLRNDALLEHGSVDTVNRAIVPQYNVYVQTSKLSRRYFLGGAIAAPMLSLAATRSTNAQIDSIRTEYEDYLYRTPLKFGGSIVDRVTLLNVHCTLRDRSGRVVKGFGSMPLGNVWSFPSKTMPYDKTLGAMKALAGRMEKITGGYKEFAHPMDINWALEPEYLKAAEAVSADMHLDSPIPKLCTLVTMSPFEAAIHDAYGKMHNRNSFQACNKDLVDHDLSHYLGSEYKGEYLDQYVLKQPKAEMPLYHLVGAVDPIIDADIQKRINDGLPETVPEWTNYNGLTHFKIKLNGSDLTWDLNRVLAVHRVVTETEKKRNVSDWVYSLDFNEKCPNVAYLIDFIRKMKEKSADCFTRIQYIEQPTKRDLELDRKNVMHEAAKLKPIVIDESLTGQDRLMLAHEMGYTGAALKACKGQTQALLMAAVAQKYKMFLCVQDLTCPGASLIHSAGLAAHIPGVAAIEANARQYVPSANKGWEKRCPGVFVVKDGMMKTGVLNGLGLSAV
jgi:L-alanine-DL-glutamate epimerase-like enolase superfamily enzyme